MWRDPKVQYLVEFGKRLRSLRNLFGLSRETFSGALGLEPRQLDDIEAGVCHPTFRILRSISDLTTCDIDLLITGQSFDGESGLRSITKEWMVHYGELVVGEQSQASAWYWESDENYRLTMSCRPMADCAKPRGIIGHTLWEHIGADPSSDEHWARHYRILEAREPIDNFIFRGHTGFIKVSGKPAFDRKGKFLGYRGCAAPATFEEAMSEWRSNLPSYKAAS